MEHACAIIVGPPNGPGAILTAVAKNLGFGAVRSYAGVDAAARQAEETPLCFFLFAAVHDVGSLRPTADAIRFCTHRSVRFSPLVYFSETPSVATIRQCVAMGFDDVITLPFTQTRLGKRLDQQVNQPKVFFEASGYFGPDRRGRGLDALRPREQRGGGQYRRLEIVRSSANGVSVIRDELNVGA